MRYVDMAICGIHVLEESLSAVFIFSDIHSQGFSKSGILSVRDIHNLGFSDIESRDHSKSGICSQDYSYFSATYSLGHRQSQALIHWEIVIL